MCRFRLFREDAGGAEGAALLTFGNQDQCHEPKGLSGGDYSPVSKIGSRLPTVTGDGRYWAEVAALTEAACTALLAANALDVQLVPRIGLILDAQIK